MSDFKSTDLILNYHDAVIYGSDLDLVRDRTSWLNDACIHFFFSLLQHTSASSSTAKFLDPSVVSFFMHQCVDDEDIEDFVGNTFLPTSGKVFIPVNDNMAVGADWQNPHGGSHWSLLVVCISPVEVQFWHFDSIRGSGNKTAARDIATKMSDSFFPKLPKRNVVDGKTPEQNNAYDCGVHMLAAAREFATIESSELKVFESKLQQFVESRPDFCSELRNEITEKILSLSSTTSAGTS